MGFAANAVMDVIAPPARPTPAAAPDAPSGPSFDDHLDAATADDAPPPDEPAAQDTDNKVEAKETTSADPQVCGPPPQQQTQQPTPAIAASLLLQMEPEAQAPAEGEQAPAAATPETPPPTNVAPPAAPVKPAPKQAPTQKAQTGDADATPEFAPVQETPVAHADDGAQPQTQPPPEGPLKQDAAKTAPPLVLPAPQTNVAPATAPQTQTTHQTQTQTNSADQVQAATAATQAAPRPEMQTPPQSKSDAARDQAKGEAAQSKDGAQNAKANAAAKGANANAEAPVFSIADAPAAPSATTANQSATALTFSTTHAGHAQHATLEQSTERAAPAATQVGREVIRRFSGGNTKFEMRLDPPELGKVEVRLEVTRDNRVTAVVAADSPQALTELARHARELEQQLQSAGLELSDSGLSFDLRQSRDEAGEADVRGTRQGGGDNAETEVATDTPIAARPIGYERWRGVRVDVMV